MFRIEPNLTTSKANPYEARGGRQNMLGNNQASLRAFGLVLLMLIAPLAGCFGENEAEEVEVSDVLLIDAQDPSEISLKAGEYHDFILVGEGQRLVVPVDVFLIVNGTLVQSGEIKVGDEGQIGGKILTTPYTTAANLTIYHQ